MNYARPMDLVDLFFPGTGATYDRVVNLCTVGFDRLWKRKIIGMIAGKPARIMDQACGTGILTFKMAKKFPECRIVGVDVSGEYLARAMGKARVMRLGNVEFVQSRAETVSWEPDFDCITSSYLAKYVEVSSLVVNIRRMLRDGGTLIVHDFTYPSTRVCALMWKLHFLVLQTIGAWVYPEWKAAFNGLPALIRETDWVEELVRALRGNGFSHISVQLLTFGASTIVTAKKSAPIR